MPALANANLSTLRRFSTLSVSLPKTLNPFPQFPNPSQCSHLGTSPMASSKVVAEYAKSGRSSCKKCSKSISAKDLRLGIVIKQQGFDALRWHHLDCFPVDSVSISSVEAIKGFSALECIDQEAVKRMVGRPDTSIKDIRKLDGHDEEAKEMGSAKAEVRKLHEREEDMKERISKKTKLSAQSEESKLEISFSISDIKDNYKGAKLLPKWNAFETIIFLERDNGLHDSTKIAAFDFDGCLARTSVKRIGADAWSLMYKSIPDKLQSLYNDGFKLVIFTNESNIERWKNKRQVAVDSKIGRLNNFIERVKVPIQVFIACGTGNGQVDDPFRKPKPGMWRMMEQHFNSGMPIDMDQSFYVGDAAGRDNDHSDADIKFAEALKLKFDVPEEYFGAAT